MKSYFLSIWNIVDPIYYSCSRLCYVPDENQNTVFRVRVTRYKGQAVKLNDGTTLSKNDLLLKIHLHNVRMLKELNAINSEMKRAVYLYHIIKKALPRLSSYLQQHSRYREIKAVIGITCLYKGSDRLGFEIISISNPYYRMYKKITFLPMQFVAGNKRYKEPVYLFMSKQKLVTEYGTVING